MLYSLLLLVSFLPRAVIAGPWGGVVCLGVDHVSAECHSAAQPPENEGCPADSPDHGAPCVDVATAGDVHAPASVTTLPGIDFVTALSVETLPIPIATSPAAHDGGDDPPPFSARAFCSSIALRR